MTSSTGNYAAIAPDDRDDDDDVEDNEEQHGLLAQFVKGIDHLICSFP